MELNPSTKSAIAELEIAVAALELGIPVLRPVAEGGRYDLVFDLPDRGLQRVQCKWSNLEGDVVVAYTGTCRLTPRGYERTTYACDEVDAVAIWCSPLKRAYYLPIDLVAGKNVVHLRLAPARNNQRVGVTMAADHELGAIAQLGERCHGMAEVEGSSPSGSTHTKAVPGGGLRSA